MIALAVLDPKLAAISRRLWHKAPVSADPAHSQPTITPSGEASQELEPKLRPETSTEMQSAVTGNIFRPVCEGGPLKSPLDLERALALSAVDPRGRNGRRGHLFEAVEGGQWLTARKQNLPAI